MPIIKHVLKTSYVIGKNVLSGTPLALTCFKAVKQCLKDVSSEDLPSAACKLAVLTCAPVYATAIIGGFATVKQFSKIKTAVKWISFVYTGPRKGLDLLAEPLEILVFGEAVPSGSLF